MMQDRDLERETKRKILLYTLAIGAILLFLASWYATQNVAELCNYAPVLGFNIAHIYFPWQYFVWANHPQLAPLIPQILKAQEKWFYIAGCICLPIGYFIRKSLVVNISHGSASWASKKDIDESGLGQYESDGKTVKKSGVVVGINPFTNKLMLHDGPEHILLMAPTRSGKGINTIIPTGLIWRHSIFFFDVKKELWQATAQYRRKVLGQKVMKFEPLCADGSTARWNPFAEIEYQTSREINDVSTIVEIMVRPDGKKSGGDDFWPDSAATLLKGVIIHLMYAHYQEGKPLPCPTDVMSFLSSPDKSTQELFEDMKMYPHISPEDFMSGHNVLHEIYGEYIQDWRSFNKTLAQWHMPPVHTIEEARNTIKKHLETVSKNKTKARDDVKWEDPPFCYLLTHPKVAECASNMLNGAEQTRASIMQTAQTAMALYQNPVVQRNTAVSDFAIRDLLDPSQAVSLYLCMQVDDVQTVKPLSRLFINTILSKLVRDMKFDVNQSSKGAGKQRLLLLLDEFPQLGNMQKIELALAVCAGYGIKMCIVSQDVNQLNKEYTKDNSIASNCHVHIYFTPNLDNGGATAKAISESLGKYTISTVSHSSGSGGLFSGSDSTSSTARDLMTPDEVSRLSWDEEIVFVAGHKPIRGKKLRYFKFPWFLNKILPEPRFSDSCTRIESYDDLFKVHAAERKELGKRAFEVQMEKAQLRLDNAKAEKATADLAIKEAREKIEELGEEHSQTSWHSFEAAESRLAIISNEGKIAEGRVNVCEANLRLMELEILLSEAETEKRAASQPEDYVAAEVKLKKVQREYNDAKEKLAGETEKEARIMKTVSADNRQIQARMNLMEAIEKLNSTRKEVDPILQEEEKRLRNASVDGKTTAEMSPRAKEAKYALDIAEATEKSAQKEYEEAKSAYSSIVEAVQKREQVNNEKARGENGSEKANAVPTETQASHETKPEQTDTKYEASGGGKATEAAYDEDWPDNVYGADPADEEMDDADFDGDLVEEMEEDESEDGSDDEGTAGGFQAEKTIDKSNNAADSDNRAKAPADGAWRTGQEQEEVGKIPEELEAAALALSEKLFHKRKARDEENLEIRHRPADAHYNDGQRGGA